MAGPMENGGRLVESTLWKENVCAQGHAAVWGSWFDTEAKKWGYACCKSSSRDEPCPVAQPASSPSAKGSPGEDSGDEVTSPDSDLETETTPMDFSNPPPDLLPSPEVAGGLPGPYIDHFVRCMLGAWRRKKEEGFQGFTDMQRMAFRDSLAEAEKALTPLLWRLKKGETLDRGEKKDTRRSRETRTTMEGKFVKEKSVLDQLFQMASSAYEKEYVRAHEAYMKLTFGNKMWNSTHVAHVAACTMKGAREYRRNRDSLNTYDMDPVSQKYMHAMKKLTHLCQCMRPNEDQSKNFVM